MIATMQGASFDMGPVRTRDGRSYRRMQGATAEGLGKRCMWCSGEALAGHVWDCPAWGGEVATAIHAAARAAATCGSVGRWWGLSDSSRPAWNSCRGYGSDCSSTATTTTTTTPPPATAEATTPTAAAAGLATHNQEVVWA